MERWTDAERTNNRSGKCFYNLILMRRLDGRTPPEITLITSLV